MSKPILNNVKFYYMDGEEYSFSTTISTTDKYYFDMSIYHHIEWKLFGIFKMINRKQIFFEKNYGEHDDYTEIRHYETKIVRIIKKYNEDRFVGSEIQKVFQKEFDGFMGVPDEIKVEMNRKKTIDSIVD